MSIPEDVLKEIKERVACYFDLHHKGNYDKKKFDEMVENEIENYNQFFSFDFSRFSSDEKDRFLDLFDSYYSDESWAHKVYLIDGEIFEFFEAKELLSDDIPESLFKSWFFDAENNIDQDDFEYDGIYYAVGKKIKEKIIKYREKVIAKEKIDPIKNILIEMEDIIGNECFNANIQNYAYWGELESEGRFFRYPLTLGEGDNKQKKNVVSSEVPSEDLIKGYYQFGANKLGIYSALYKVLKHLEEKYGFKIPKN